MLHRVGGMPRILLAGLTFQHLLAVFAGTIFVPVMVGLPVPLALFFSGVSTIMFHFFTRGKIPVFLSSSFTSLAGMLFVRQTCLERGMTENVALCYVGFGMLVMSVMYLMIAQLMRLVTRQTVERLFPPVVAGAFIMSLGADMLFSATYDLSTSPFMGLCVIIVLVIVQLFSRGVMKMMSINCSVLVALGMAVLQGGIDTEALQAAKWVEQPFAQLYMSLGILEKIDAEMIVTTILTVTPFAFISVAEHIADMFAISRTTRVDYVRTMGLPRTLTATGLPMLVASVFGASPATVYTQTTGLVMLNRVCDPVLMRLCALVMIVLSFSPKIATLMGMIPIAIIGGITFVMYCMVIVVGWTTISRSPGGCLSPRSAFIAGVVMAVTLYVKFFMDGHVKIGSIEISSLVVAWAVGLCMNVMLPEKDVITPGKNMITPENEKHRDE